MPDCLSSTTVTTSRRRVEEQLHRPFPVEPSSSPGIAHSHAAGLALLPPNYRYGCRTEESVRMIDRPLLHVRAAVHAPPTFSPRAGHHCLSITYTSLTGLWKRRTLLSKFSLTKRHWEDVHVRCCHRNREHFLAHTDNVKHRWPILLVKGPPIDGFKRKRSFY